MGKIQEILDGFNNGTLTNDEEFARLLDKNESNFVIHKAYNNFKKIASQRPLKATDIVSFQENVIENLIENYDEEDDEDVKYCTTPGNQHKEGCPCIFGVVEFIKQVTAINKQNEIRQKEWDYKDRLRKEKYAREKEKFDIDYANLSKSLDELLPIRGGGCYNWFLHADPQPVEPDILVSYRHPTESCDSRTGYWKWYFKYKDSYKHNAKTEFIQLHTPTEDKLDNVVFLPPPVYQGQCCVNNITASDAAKVTKVKQICNQSINILGANETAEANEIAKREAEEEAEEERIAEEEEKRIIEEEAASKKKKIFIIVVALLLFFLFCGAFAFFIFNGEDVSKTPVDQQPAPSGI